MSYRVDCALSVFMEEKEKKEPMQSWVIRYMYIYFIIIDLTFDLFVLFGEVVYRWVFGEDRFRCNNVFTMRPWGVVFLLSKANCSLEKVIQVDPNDHWWLRFFSSRPNFFDSVWIWTCSPTKVGCSTLPIRKYISEITFSLNPCPVVGLVQDCFP